MKHEHPLEYEEIRQQEQAAGGDGRAPKLAAPAPADPPSTKREAPASGKEERR